MNNFFWILIIVGISFLAPYIQGRQLNNLGSDHSVHIFLINVLRENRFRLFSQVPRIVNPSYCGACPLFLHWFLAIAGPRAIPLVSKVLNPLLNTATVVATFFALKCLKYENQEAVSLSLLICFGLAIFPQFYHALSARNYGISSRPLGLLLFVVVIFLSYVSSIQDEALVPIMVGSIIAYGIWGCNTFASQSLLFFSVIMGLVFQQWSLLLMASVGIVLFCVLHRGYATSYIWHTVLFSITYSRELASVFILKRHHSLWKDILFVIIQKFYKEKFSESFKYAYENSFLILFFINVVSVLALLEFTVGHTDQSNSLALFSSRIALIAVIIFFVTSLRATRFLGEPERYLELAAPFSIIAAFTFLDSYFGLTGIIILLVYFSVATLIQIILSHFVKKSFRHRSQDVQAIVECINSCNVQPGNIRLASNNDEIQKYFMPQPWSFIRYWSYEETFAGYRVRSAFETFPFVKMEVLEAAIRQYGANFCLIEKQQDSDLFADDREWRSRSSIILDNNKYRVYSIDQGLITSVNMNNKEEDE